MDMDIKPEDYDFLEETTKGDPEEKVEADQLEALFSLVVKHITDKLITGDITPQELGFAIKLLKDNCITLVERNGGATKGEVKEQFESMEERMPAFNIADFKESMKEVM